MVIRKFVCKECSYDTWDFQEAKDHYIYAHLVITEQFVIKMSKDKGKK